MEQNIVIAGATFNGVPSIEIPTSGGGSASFVEVSDTTATAADVAHGKYFYTANGVKTAGTGEGSAVVQPLSVTQNGTYNPPSGVDGFAPVTVNVSGGGGGGQDLPVLPSEYQEVEYLVCSGEQYCMVDSHLLFTNLLSGKAKAAVNDSNQKTIVGYYGSSGGSRIAVSVVDDQLSFNNLTDIASTADSDELVFTFLAHLSQTGTGYTRLSIGAYARNSVLNFFIGNIYPVYVMSGGGSYPNYGLEYTYAYIPCYRKADNKPGLYDVINDVFYTNQGTGADFGVGPDAN